jgi:hypothetical protein
VRSRVHVGVCVFVVMIVTSPVGALWPAVAGASTMSVLRDATNASSYSYELSLVKTCEVGDGLAVVKNVGTTSLRLTSIAVLYGGARADQARTTFALISFRRGTNEGQLGATFDLSGLDGGVDLGNAVGGVIEPITTSGRSYDIVAKILVLANHTSSWKIDGLRVTYDVGARAYATVLAQSITLSSTSDCS